MYLNADEYKELSGKIEDEDILEKFLKKGERYIDILTFNRIKRYGFENCSNFEKEIIKEVQTELIDFQFANKEYINSYLNSYNLNGVSIVFGDTNTNIKDINGVIIPVDTYQKLNMTRFTSLIL